MVVGLSLFQSQAPFAFATNLAGRVRVQADTLKLEDARIRAHGVVNLQAKHVTSSANTSIAAPDANYDLGSTNGTLVYRGLSPVGQPNLTGTIRVFVTSWTNTAEFPDPAAAAATTDPTAGTRYRNDHDLDGRHAFPGDDHRCRHRPVEDLG
jgi:hypothetical protein